MPTSAEIQRAADLIWHHLNEGGFCPPVRSFLGETDLQAAYAVQEINTQRKIERGELVVGAKIGLTSEAVQQQLGVDQPDFGILTDRVRIENGGNIRWNELHQPKAEAEIGFILGEDLTGPMTLESLSSSIEAAVPCIEVVGSRVESWNIRITDTIADNASASHFVLGEPVSDWNSLDLEGCTMRLIKNGEISSEGSGKACMGNPLNAALWLANTMHALNRPLKKGFIILAGALGPMVSVDPNDEFTAYIDGFKPVRVSFGSV